MKRSLVPLLVTTIALLLGVVPAQANHATGHLSETQAEPIGPPTLENGKGTWTGIGNFPAGPGGEKAIGVDVERFSRGGHRYVITSSMTIGFSIFDVTDPENPVRVSDYGSAVCGAESNTSQLVYFLTHSGDFRATEQAVGQSHGWEDDIQVTPDGRIAIIAADFPGRCHDPAAGGFELVNISDPDNPTLLGLVRLRGGSHNSTIDRDRPWIAYNSNSDVNTNNFIDVVDFKSCLALVPAKCRPHVVRFQFQNAWTASKTTIQPSACHDIVSMLHKLWAACVNTTMVLDPSHLWQNGHLAGTDLTDPKQVGKDDACKLVDPSPEAMTTGLKVVDCFDWSVEKWKKAHLENAHIKLVSLIRHPGYMSDEDAPTTSGIQISHGAEPAYGGRIMMVSDERGGGTNTSPGECPGGGVWFYDMRKPAHPVVTRTRKGKKGVFVPSPADRVETGGNNCTAHVFWEWPREGHLVSMAWYSSGTQVFRFKVNFARHPARIRFYARRAFVPPGASTWTSRIYAERKTVSQKVLYFVATDISRGFDFFKLTIPLKSAKGGRPL